MGQILLGNHIDMAYERSSQVRPTSTNIFLAQLSNCNIKILLFGIALGSCITLPCHKPYLVTAYADLSSCLHPPVASAWISRTALPWSVESIVRSVGCFGAGHSMHDEAYDDATQKKTTNRYSADGLCLITRQ
jgi:hypothetical protein